MRKIRRKKGRREEIRKEREMSQRQLSFFFFMFYVCLFFLHLCFRPFSIFSKLLFRFHLHSFHSPSLRSSTGTHEQVQSNWKFCHLLHLASSIESPACDFLRLCFIRSILTVYTRLGRSRYSRFSVVNNRVILNFLVLK